MRVTNTKPCNCKYCGGNVIRGSGIVPFVNYYFKSNKSYGSAKPFNGRDGYTLMYSDGTNNYARTSKNTIAFALGKERWGSYADMYNIIGGSNDNGMICGVNNALKEYGEEAKVKLSINDFDKMKKKIVMLPVRNGFTMVIFLNYDTLSLSKLNTVIAKCNNDVSIPFREKEMEKLTWVFSTRNKVFFDLNTGKVLKEGTKGGISSFGSKVISSFYK